jgi:hypothetical protein
MARLVAYAVVAIDGDICHLVLGCDNARLGGSWLGEVCREFERREAMFYRVVKDKEVGEISLGEGAHARQARAEDSDVHFHHAGFQLTDDQPVRVSGESKVHTTKSDSLGSPK